MVDNVPRTVRLDSSAEPSCDIIHPCDPGVVIAPASVTTPFHALEPVFLRWEFCILTPVISILSPVRTPGMIGSPTVMLSVAVNAEVTVNKVAPADTPLATTLLITLPSSTAWKYTVSPVLRSSARAVQITVVPLLTVAFTVAI